MLNQVSFKTSIPVSTGFFALLAFGSLCQAQPPTVLTNGSAEEGSGKTIAGWNFSKGDLADDAIDYGVTSQATDGKQGFHIALLKPEQANVWWVQEIPIAPGTKSFEISCDAKSTTDAARTAYAVPAISCYFIDTDKNWIQWQEIQYVPETSDWITLKRNIAVPPKAGLIGIRLGTQSKGVVDTVFDNIKVIPHTEAYLDVVATGDIETTTKTMVPGWNFKKQLGNEQQLTSGISSDASNGKQSLRLAALEGNAEVHGYWSQEIATTPGIANYKLSLRAKLAGAAGANQADATVGYGFLDEQRRSIGYMPFGLVTDKNWTDFSAQVSPPAEVKFIEIRLAMDGIGANEALFDDIKLVPAP